MKNYCYADFAFGGVTNRNNIQNIYECKRNGIKTDCYRGVYLYDETLKIYVEKTGHSKDYAGKHIADYLEFDFDGENLEEVKKVSHNFVMYLHHEFEVPFEYMNIAFSGSKGFHVSISMNAICDNPQPKDDFCKICKGIAKDLGGDFKFVDFSIYEPKRLFRMINTINSKSGLYKIPLELNELKELSVDDIKRLAKGPRSIEQLPISEISVVPRLNDLYKKWSSTNFNKLMLNEAKRDELLDIIRNGVGEGERHNAVIRITGLFQKRGFDYDFIIENLRLLNNKFNPPLEDERFVYRKVNKLKIAT